MATKKTGSLKGTDVVLITSVNLAADVGASVLPVANGGTGTGTWTDGQIAIGNTTGNTLVKTTLTGTSNQVVVTNGAGAITLSLPQSIAMISTPTFAGATIDGHSIGRGAFSNESNLRVGVGSLAANSSGTSNLALGPYALANTVSSAGLVGIGYGAGSHLLDGSTPLTDSDHSVYLGDDTRASADNVSHEIVIGSGGRGIGAGTTVVGTTNSTAFRAWGTPTFGPANSLTLGLGSLTAARTLTVPDVSSTILVASDIGASVQAYSASTTLLGNTVTGTGSIVLATSPTLVTPVLGVASATSLACPTFSSAGAIGITPAANNPYVVNLSGASGVYQIKSQAADAIACYDVSALAAGTGGGMYFGGNYTGSTTTTWAAIRGPKENSTDGQYGGYLSFLTRAHGASHAEVMQLTSAGVTIVRGPLTLKGYTVAGLPTGVVGHLAYVTDALAPAYGVALVGGGAITTMAFYIGAAWVAH